MSTVINIDLGRFFTGLLILFPFAIATSSPIRLKNMIVISEKFKGIFLLKTL
jgi:hypothetical protein